MEINEFIKAISSKKTLKKAFSTLDIDTLNSIKEGVDFAYLKRAEDAEIEKLEEIERQEKIKKFANLIKEEGLDVEQITKLLGNSKAGSNRKKREPKYKYIDFDLTEKTWTGQGRTPKAIQSKLDEGALLSDFLIL